MEQSRSCTMSVSCSLQKFTSCHCRPYQVVLKFRMMPKVL